PAGAVPEAADGFVSISATVSPEQPVPEESFTVEATITNAEDSTSSYRVDQVTVRRGADGSSEVVAERDGQATIQRNRTRTISIDATLNETGTHTVYLHVELVDDQGDRRTVVQPVTVEVIQPHPQVDVSTDPSAPGADQTMTISVSNGLEQAVRNVEVIVDGESVEISNPRRVAATVAAGGTTAFEFRTTPDSETTHPVEVTIRYSVDGERREVTRTLTADFSETETTTEHPQVGISTESAAPDEPRTMTVTLSNGLEQSIRNVEVTVAGRQVEIGDARRVTAALQSGSSQAFEFTATPAVNEKLPVNVTVEYTLDGERRGVTYTLGADFTIADEPAEHPQVELGVQDAIAGATRSVNVTVANGLPRDVRQVTVLVSSPAVDFEATERVRSTLTAGQTARFSFPAVVDALGTHPVNVTLIYTDDGIRQRVTRTFQASFSAPPNPGNVTLTGISAVARDGTLEISATASNVGSGPVESVVVSVPGSEAVEATDYFVGKIEGSDFSSFTISTAVVGNVSKVPVEVTYVVDGVQKSFTTTVSVEQQIVRQPRNSGGSGGVPLIPIGIAVALVVVLGIAYRIRG
ncbi:MAG: hypothetical protein ABEI99_12800, partial [Halobaculum sp.]